MKNAILNMKLVVMALSALLVISCSAEDGEDGAIGSQGIAGADGANGIDGINGQDGVNGADGEDGNANVSTFIFDATGESGASIDLTIPELTQNVLENDVILWYLQVGNLYYSIPGSGPNADYVARTYAQFGGTRINFHNWDGSSYSLTAGDIDNIKIIIIGSTGTTVSKNAAIDFKKMSYEEVMNYLGLDY